MGERGINGGKVARYGEKHTKEEGRKNGKERNERGGRNWEGCNEKKLNRTRIWKVQEQNDQKKKNKNKNRTRDGK